MASVAMIAGRGVLNAVAAIIWPVFFLVMT